MRIIKRGLILWNGCDGLQLSANSAALTPLDSLVGSAKVDPNTQPVCDVTFENSLCLRNGKHVILPPALSDGLVARYNFDSGSVIDSSGNGHHGLGQVYPGPAPFGGDGYSAVFRQTQITVPSINIGSIDTGEWSLSFWLFLLIDSAAAKTQTDDFCPILSRGQGVSANPAIWISGKTGTVRVGLATTRDPTSLEFLESNARLNRQQWYRVTVTRQEKRVLLYINGVKDSYLDTGGDISEEEGSVTLGGSGCGDLPMLLDDLQVWNRALGSLYIEALSSVGLGIEPARFELSCVKCTKTEAEEGCSDAYHLCSDEEMVGAGVLHAVQSLGWTRLGYRVFTSGPQKGVFMQTHTPPIDEQLVPADSSGDGIPGLGICCRD